MTSCSVVMVSYQTGPVLFASINTVLKQKNLAELVVVDNGNRPDVLARLQQISLGDPRLKIIPNNGNVGFARGANIGAKITSGYYLALINPDCLLPPDALADAMAAFESDSAAVVVGAEILNPDGSAQTKAIRPILSPSSAIKQFFSFSRKSSASSDRDDVHSVPAISDAFMCIRRKDYERLSGLDEAFYVRGAAMDLCMRVYKFGGKILFMPKVKITRLHTNSQLCKRAIEWHQAKGLVHYFRKHYAARTPLGFMFIVRAIVMMRFILRVGSAWIGRQVRPTFVMSHTIPAKRLMVLASGLADLPQKDDLYGKTVLVTGATSQIGLCVVKQLISRGAAVLAMSRGEPIPYQHEHLRWIKGDLTDNKLYLDGYLIDVVVHCAPLWHLPLTIDLLADAEVKRIIAFGTTSVFGKVLSRNFHERNLVEKLSRAEKEVTERCSDLSINCTILRPTMTYGVGLDLNVTSLAKLINFMSFFPVYPPAFGRRQPVHADDLAIAVLQVMDNEITYGKSYNLGGGEVVTYREMLNRLFKMLRKKPRIEINTMLPFLLDIAGKLSGKRHINGEIARRMNDDLIFFHDDARRDFDFNPRPFLSRGIKDIEGY